MGSSDTDTSSEIRYAPYVEDHHKIFLDLVAVYRAALIDDSPFSDFSAVLIDAAFFGTGYTLSSFPSLYDMYGKFMAGLDIETLFDQSLEDTLNGNAVNELVSQEAISLSDDLVETAIPRFTVGMRDINSVISSTFVVGKAMMETARTKALARFSAEIRYRLIPAAIERWKGHLDWNRGVITMYSEILKLYIAAKIDVNNHNYEMLSKDKLWPFTVLDYERAALGALQTATNMKQVSGESNKTASAIGGALSGAAAGYQVSGANPMGAFIGGILGLAGGLF